MEELIQKYRESDVVGFASPVYTWDMTANLKAFVDRLCPMKAPVMTVKNGHMDMEDGEVKNQKFVALSNCGFPGNDNFRIIKQVFAAAEPVLEIYRNCGKLLVSEQEVARELVKPYLAAVEQAGYELADGGDVSDDTRRALEMELMSIPEYAKFLGM